MEIKPYHPTRRWDRRLKCKAMSTGMYRPPPGTKTKYGGYSTYANVQVYDNR